MLDDDPTGVQMLAGVRVLLEWDPQRVQRALDGRTAVHLLTNARALSPRDVPSVVASAGRAASRGAPEADLVLRGDSTLRGHLREELLGLHDVLPWTRRAPVLVVPALPSAGRVTVGGVHMLERNGARVPLDVTEYAHDGVFSYSTSQLLAWAEERSGGLLPAQAGRGLDLGELRSLGPRHVASVLADLCSADRSAAFAPDAETIDDLQLIAEGYGLARDAGCAMVVRCAPAFVGILSRTIAVEHAPAPSANDGLLVVCGSYVSTTTRQLSRLRQSRKRAFVEVDVAKLTDDRAPAEVARVVGKASYLIATDGLAVVATERHRPPRTTSLHAGQQIAGGLAAIVRALDPRPRVIVAKGGITSHVTLSDGLGVKEAEVVGPVLPGVSYWRAESAGRAVDYLVCPGNVGDDELLLTLVDVLQGSTAC